MNAHMIFASDVMTAPVLVAHPDMTVVELERLLIDRNIWGLPVVANDKLVGTVSRSDIVRQVTLERSIAEYSVERQDNRCSDPEQQEREIVQTAASLLSGKCVRDIMVDEIITATMNDTVDDMARMMIGKNIHRIIIVKNNRPIGIVTAMDIVRAIVQDVPPAMQAAASGQK